jgi:hypothetical protein
VLKISRWKPIGSNISNPTFAMFNTSLLGGRYGEAEPEKGLFPDISTSVGLLMPHPSGLPWKSTVTNDFPNEFGLRSMPVPLDGFFKRFIQRLWNWDVPVCNAAFLLFHSITFCAFFDKI